MSADKYDPPKESLADKGHAVLRSAAGMIPFAGQAAVELLNSILVPPVERRRLEWQCSIAEGLREVERRQLCVFDELNQNDLFIDTLMQASLVAMRTSNKEKRESLRNIVLNSALPGAPDESRQAMFVQLIDTLSPLHLHVLSFLDDPKKWIAEHQITLPQHSFQTLWMFFLRVFKDSQLDESLYERVCVDLHEKGLLIASSLRKQVSRFPYDPEKPREKQPGYYFVDELPSDVMVSMAGQPTALRHWTTHLGRQFLAFIASPIDEPAPQGA